ncbi:MAG TPA: DUF4340 domain-containing protein [Thermoanaerobaculia bacterium]|jgi:hypothetical protein|nr:DUF4340 domain-containing protein [Thermoanaerobaculia bacterium]
MRPRSLGVLALVVLALGAFVWFYERKLPTTAEAKAQAKKLLPGVEADEVREVVIERGGQKVRLVREGEPPPTTPAGEEEMAGPPSEWRLTAPLAARADRTQVEGLLASLLGMEKGRTLEHADRRQYGLEPPAARVTLVTAKARRVVDVGREIPATDERAVALAGASGGPATVYAVAGSFWGDLAKPTGDWRSRELFPGAREEVERVSLHRDGGSSGGNLGSTQGATVVLARRGEEPWIEAPLADHADRERFDQLLDALTALQAIDFLDQPPGPPATLGLAPPQGVIEAVRKAKPQPFRLELGATHGEGEQAVQYARVDGQLVTLKAPALGEALARPPQEWRSRTWTDFAVYEVDKLVARDHQGAFTLTRADADWKRDGVKIFYGTVSDLLGTLADAKATKVLDAAAAQGLAAGAPALTLELTGTGGKRQTLTVWPATAGAAGEGAPARTSGRDALLLMPAALPADLAKEIAAIRKAEPLKPEATPAPPAPGQ